MIKFSEPIFFGRFIRRYQRFFMDVLLDNGEKITAHTPNTGSMRGLLIEGAKVLLTKSHDAKRRYPFTTQAIEVDGVMVGINTHLPNQLIKSSLTHPLLKEIADYRTLKAEVPFGIDARSRVDFYFCHSETNRLPLFLEIKNVTMRVGDHAQFPDAVSTRALKHVHDLVDAINHGSRAALWFIVQRQDCSAFSPAHAIDQQYAEHLAQAARSGLEIRALAAHINETGLTLTHELPCNL